MKHLLEIDSIQLKFKEKIILSNVYLKCETNNITGLLGRNGQGKSCLMKIIFGTLRTEKSIRFDTKPITESSNNPELLVFLPQFNFIPKFLSLTRVLSDFGLDLNNFLICFPEFKGRDKSSIGSLSGGERRLIELYVIVKYKSNFAMLDEPFTHLNPLQIEKAKKLIIEEKKNKGFIITDHLYSHIIELSDNLYILVNGQINLIKDKNDILRLGYINS